MAGSAHGDIPGSCMLHSRSLGIPARRARSKASRLTQYLSLIIQSTSFVRVRKDDRALDEPLPAHAIGLRRTRVLRVEVRARLLALEQRQVRLGSTLVLIA